MLSNQNQPHQIGSRFCNHLKLLEKKRINQFILAGPKLHCQVHNESRNVEHCLHCAVSFCSSETPQKCIVKHHDATNNLHVFTVQPSNCIIRCSLCNDSIQGLMFQFSGEHSNNYMKMMRFGEYIKEAWLAIYDNSQKQAIVNAHKGIANLGNTCFLSVVLQSLSSTTALARIYSQHYTFYKEGYQQRIKYSQKLLNKSIEIYYDQVLENKSSQSWITVKSTQKKSSNHQFNQNKSFLSSQIRNCELNMLFREFLIEMNQNSNIEKNTVNPQKILDKLCEFNIKYEKNEEQDAEQLLLLLIDTLSQGQKNALQKDNDRYKAIESILGPQKIVPIQNIFGSYLLNETICRQCQKASYALDLTYHLPLSFNKIINHQKPSFEESFPIKDSLEFKNFYYDLQLPTKSHSENSFQMLEIFFQSETLTKQNNYYQCANCSSLLANRRTFLVCQPQVLVISFKRFNAKFEKNNEFVQFPEMLDIKSICATGSNGTQYRLYGVIVHEGSKISSGHYYNFIRIDETWMKCSDSKVKSVKWREVKIQQAYILLYEKISGKKQ